MKNPIFTLIVFFAVGVTSRADLPNPLTSTWTFPTTYRAILHVETDFLKGDYAVNYQRDSGGTIQKFQIETVTYSFRVHISAAQAGRRLMEQSGMMHVISTYEGGALVQQSAIDENGNASAPESVPLSEVPRIGILPVSVSGAQFVGRDIIDGSYARHYLIRYGFPTTDMWLDEQDGHMVASRQNGVYYQWRDYRAAELAPAESN